MAASIRPLYPPSCPLKHSSSSQSIIKSYSPFSLSEPHRPISISTSVSFNPSGNYDLSLFEEEGTQNLAATSISQFCPNIRRFCAPQMRPKPRRRCRRSKAGSKSSSTTTPSPASICLRSTPPPA